MPVNLWCVIANIFCLLFVFLQQSTGDMLSEEEVPDRVAFQERLANTIAQFSEV